MPHLDAAWRFARWLSSTPADAEDVVQEAMLRAFRAFDSLRGGDVKSWLFAIVRNCQASAHRRALTAAAAPLPEELSPAGLDATADVPQHEAQRRDERRLLIRLMAALAPEQREVLVLREIEDLSYREIAHVMGVPLGTVMSRLARARSALKARWLEASGEPA